MKYTKQKNQATVFRRRFSNLFQIFFIIALLDALYILSYVLMFITTPSDIVSGTHLLSHVKPMTEHVLLSVVLLLGCGIAEETVFRSM